MPSSRLTSDEAEQKRSKHEEHYSDAIIVFRHACLFNSAIGRCSKLLTTSSIELSSDTVKT